MSKEIKYNLSFTGYSFGALFAERSVFICYDQFRSKTVRAVTFESPGSAEFFMDLRKENYNYSRVISNKYLNDIDLDIKTYLLPPNLFNSQKHIGKVYQVCEPPLMQNILDLDDFITKEIINKIQLNDFTKFYSENIKPNLRQFSFIFNGLNSFFSNDGLDYILSEFEEKTGELNDIKEVIEWPEMSIELEQDMNKLFDRLKDLIPLEGQFYQEPAAFYLILQVIIVKFFQIILFGGDLEMIKNENESKLIKPITRIIAKNIIHIHKKDHKIKSVNVKEDILFHNNLNHVDIHLFTLFCANNYESSPIWPKFNELKNSFVIDQSMNKKNEFQFYSIRSDTTDIEHIRSRLIRLDRIDSILLSKLKIADHVKENDDDDDLVKKSSKSKYRQLLDDFGDRHMSRTTKFIKNETNIFEMMNEKLEINQCIFLYGRAGVGKTTVAREYCYEKKEKHKTKCTIQFVDVPDGIDLYLKKLKKTFDIKEENNFLSILKNKLETYSRTLIFIFDDVRELDEISKITSILIGQKHKFIVTTRNQIISTDSSFIGIEIQPFDETKCLAYLQSEIFNYDIKITNNLLHDLHNIFGKDQISILPKSLKSMMAGWRHEKKNLEIKTYYRYKIRKWKEDLVNEGNELAFDLLKHLVYLNGGLISAEILNELFVNENKAANDDRFDKALSYLIKNSYIKIKNDKKTAYEIHKETQIEMITFLLDNEKEEILPKIALALNMSVSIEALYENTLKTSPKDFDIVKLKEINDHTIKINEVKWAMRRENKDFIDLLNKMSNVNVYIFFDYENASKLLYTLLDINTDTHNKAEKAFTKQKLGWLFYQKRDFRKALLNLEEAHKLMIQCLPSFHHEIGNTLNYLGLVNKNMENFDQALKNFNQALNIYNKQQNNNVIYIAATLNNIGLVYDMKGQPDDALRFYEDSLKILDVNHQCIADTFDNIGIYYKNKNDFKNALEKMHKALEIREKSLLANDPKIVASLNNIGSVYERQGKHIDALDCYKRALEIIQEIMGLSSRDPLTGDVLKNLANLYRDTREYEKALTNFQELLEIRKLSLGESHSSIGHIYLNMGDIFKIKAQFNEALDCFKIASEIFKSNDLVNLFATCESEINFIDEKIIGFLFY